MANTFKELKEGRKKSFLRVSSAMSDEFRKARNARISSFVLKVLSETGQDHTAQRMKGCERGSLCGYVYCGHCREKHAQALLRRYQAHIGRQQMDDNECRDRIRWVTVLHDLVPCDLEQIQAATKRGRKDYSNFNRKWDGTWAQGVFEFELVDMKKVINLVGTSGGQSRKRKTLMGMCNNQNKNENQNVDDWVWIDDLDIKRTDYVLLHTHFLMDGGANDWDKISRDMRLRWPGSYHVNADKLYDSEVRELGESLRIMANYSFKNRARYHYNFGNYKHEEDLADENMFSKRDMRNVFNIYEKMNGKNNKGILLGWNGMET